MNFEPEKFFIGLVDFFAIIMPGALAAYLGKDWIACHLLGQSFFRLDGAESWLLFLFVSYLLGHFAFLLGSFLDELVYDRFRRCTYWGQLSRLAEGKRRSGRFWRWLAQTFLFFGTNADDAVMQVLKIKAGNLQAIAAQSAINAFQWCKASLSKDHAEGLVAVQRLEADSKFFRSFAVVLAVVGTFYLAQCRIGPALVCGVLVALALLRYVDQRFKATQQAYWFVITLEAAKPQAVAAAPAAPTGEGFTHAGGVVFRERDGLVEYLLVQAKDRPDIWVLPKGHVEAGETMTQTAVREAYEEAGCWARVLQWIGTEKFAGDGSQISKVAFYLMACVDELPAEQLARLRRNQPSENRDHQWLALADAKEKASFDETKRLLGQAEEARNKMASPSSRFRRAVGRV